MFLPDLGTLIENVHEHGHYDAGAGGDDGG
jgi:hypothetical protein